MTQGKLLRSFGIIVLAAVVAASGAYLWGQNAVPQYRSVARLLVYPNLETYQGRDLLTAIDTLARTGIIFTYVEVLNSERIVTGALEAAGVPLEQHELYRIKSVAVPESAVLEVTVEGPSAVTVHTLTDELIDSGREYLETRIPTFELTVLDPAVLPDEPYSPNPPRDMSLAAALAVALTIAMLVGLSALRETSHVSGESGPRTGASKVAGTLSGAQVRGAARR